MPSGPGMDRFGGTGVTIFFVLSGYLITGSCAANFIAPDASTSRGSSSAGPDDLLPALLVTVSVVGCPLRGAAGERWWSWSYLAPILFYYGNWWWLANWPLGALSHTWSLAVEEQFYLLWPLLVMVTRRWFVPVVAVLALGSLALESHGRP